MKRMMIACLLAAMASLAQAQRQEINLKTWQFSHDQASWQTVNVPHDWAISGPFDKKWDLQTVAIEQNGETEKTEKSGRSGALPWIGEGWYKCSVNLKGTAYKHAYLCFDGAMSEPKVYVNGKLAGEWAYGYNAFRIDATPYLHDGDNEISVHLRNLEESSRWYPGAGIYRPVKLVLTGDVRIDPWQLFVRTLSADSATASVAIDVQVLGLEKQDTANSRLKIAILDANMVHIAEQNAPFDKQGRAHAVLKVSKPNLWSPETPYLYKVVVKAISHGETQDQYVLNTGIRTISVSKEHGLQLNGVTRKIKGVCLHHDLGPLGAAVNKAALIRQVREMKDMGADAIRTSHNMPSEMQMQVCDSMGMMVMAESFDMWKYPKVKNGYSRFFDEWSDRDITNLVLHHRNHPAIVMWSIGNEIPEQGMKGGRNIAMHLQDICHQLDPTRSVTQGMDRVDNALSTGFAQVMDIPGFNYRVNKYEMGIKKLWQGYLLGSETASTVSSRGVYKFPVEYSAHHTYPDGQCSGYDTEWCSWSNLPETDFIAMDDYPYTIGQFVWTGFDYLGEPTPYDEYWPSRSSYFGICDLAGLPKDRYYLYRSVWNHQSHTLHLLPHWTWPGREGKTTPVYCYTDYPEAELFVNGKSQGRIKKNKQSMYDRYRLRWNDVKYEPGELKVVAYDANGKRAGEETVRTAGTPARLRLTADRGFIHADGTDLMFVTVEMTDKKGTLCPDADDELLFEVSGAGTFKAVCNGDATSLEPFTQPRMKLFHGKLVVIVQAADAPGTAWLDVRTAGKPIKQRLKLIVK